MGATLSFQLRKHWRELQRGRPGHRFQSRYERARRTQNRGGAGKRIALIVLALVFLAIGAVLSVIPGPAIPFFFVAGGLLAAESRPVARFMDGCEVVGRRVVAWGKRHWNRLPLVGRIVVLVIGGCCSMATAYFGYQLVRG
jgi:hypothetical protein